MADNTAALVVALSAQITKFESDMNKAVGVAGKKTKEIEDKFVSANKAIAAQGTALATNLSNNVGGLGTVLAKLGPVGLGTAAALGGLALGMKGIVDATNKWVEELGRLKDASETIGLTVTQLHALERAGLDTGTSAEKINVFLTKFVGNLEQLKDGEGDLFKALQKIDFELVKQLNSAKSTAEAFDILAKAFLRLQSESEKIQLGRAAGGRGAADVGRLFTETEARGGLVAMTAATRNLDDQAKRYDEIRDRITQIKKDTDEIWGNMFSSEILSLQLKQAEAMKALAVATNEVQQAARTQSFNVGFLNTLAAPFKLLGDIVSKSLTTLQKLKDLSSGVANFDVAGMVDKAGQIAGATSLGPTVTVPLPPERPLIETIGQQLTRLKTAINLLNDAATAEEQYRLKQLEVKKALEDKSVSQDVANRTLLAAKVAEQSAIQAIRERLGVATEENILAQKQRELELEKSKRQLTTIELVKAETVARKEAREEAERSLIRQAQLPDLKKLELDAANATKALDQFATQSARAIEDAFVDIATQTKTLSEAFNAMVTAILKDLARLIIRQTITAPLASLLQGLFAGTTTTGGFGLKIGTNAAGTNSWRGGLTWVGEQGPELVNLPKGTQIFPSDIARGVAGGGGVVIGGATINIAGDASERTIGLIRLALAEHDRTLPNKVITAVRSARERNVPL